MAIRIAIGSQANITAKSSFRICETAVRNSKRNLRDNILRWLLPDITYLFFMQTEEGRF